MADVPDPEPPVVDVPEPPMPEEPPEMLANRNIHIPQAEQDVLSLEETEEFEIPENFHIHLLVNGDEQGLESQTNDISSLHISGLVDSDKLLKELEASVPQNILENVDSIEHAKQLSYLVGNS